jgi:hypothetical protein
MALNAEEQELFDFAVAALPKWFTSSERQREDLYGFAKLFGNALTTVRYWFSQALIGQADGPVSGLPDWLDLHARDRGTSRQNAETTVAMRKRVRTIGDAVTRPPLLVAVDALLAAESISGTAAMVELPYHGAHAGEYDAMTGTGGAFSQDGAVSTFTPTALPWPRPPFRGVGLVPELTFELEIAGAAQADNNGQRAVEELDGNGAIVANVDGDAGADPTVTWTVHTLDADGNERDGWARAYSQRGYRSARRRPRRIVIILPFGSTEGTASSVREMLRQKKAAGIAVTVERRLVAP